MLLPFQFPSLGHLDEEVKRVTTRSLRVEGLSAMTEQWALGGYRSLRRLPHILRHTFCTLLSRSGVSDRLAMQAMGHADLRMLRYQHVFNGEVARELQRLRLEL